MKKLFNKWRKLPNSVKSALVFTIATFFVKGISFIVTPIFTRIMNINDYGIIVTYNSWVSIIDVFAILGLTSAGVFNVGLNDNKDKRDRYISNCLGLCNVTTILVFSIIFIIKHFIYHNFLLDNVYLFIMFINFLFSPAQIFWLTRQKYEYKYKLAAFITIISTIISQGLSILFVYSFKTDIAIYKLLGNEIGVLLFAIPIYIFLLKNGKQYFNYSEWKKILKLAIPLIPHYLAQHIMSSSDRIMISTYVSKADAAIYGVVSYISLIASIIWNSINASLVPFTFDKLNQKKYNDINKVSMKLIVGCALICAFVIIIAPEVMSILAPNNYKAGVYAVPPLVFVVYLQALYNLFANIEFYHKKTGKIALSTCIASFTNVILNILIIPKYGFIGASYTTLVSTIVNVVLHYFNYKKCQDNDIYDIKNILLLSIGLFAFSLLANLLYINNIVRYGLIVISLLLLVVFKNKVLGLIKMLKTR